MAYCGWFDNMVEALEGGTPEDLDEAISDFLAAGMSYTEAKDAPGLQQDILDFAAALDAADFITVEEFINNMLAYCEPYYDREAGI
jgi:hypothetical protein